jgi:hypothetical protein
MACAEAWNVMPVVWVGRSTFFVDKQALPRYSYLGSSAVARLVALRLRRLYAGSSVKWVGLQGEILAGTQRSSFSLHIFGR